MMEGSLSQAAQITHGTLKGSDALFHGVSTDSRTLAAGELFVALTGPNFDGSRFVDAAGIASAAGAVVQSKIDAALPLITVDDSRAALGKLAAAWRRQMPASVVGITGSNGKTTLKEMIAACLSGASRTLATEGNLNNEIGVPQMLLRLSPEHEFAVMEMGANHPGEIAYLAAMVAAEVVVITNAAPAHLEGFGNLEGVARAKGEILETESRPRVAVLNADDPFFTYWRERAADLELLTFALDCDATVTANDIRPKGHGTQFTLQLPDERVSIDLPLAGRHNVLNACAAATVALALNLSAARIREGLQAVRPVSGRLQPAATADGAVVYDDAYNANPESVRIAAEFLAAQPGDSILVLGDMGELGETARALHIGVGQAAREAGVGTLLATGELMRHAVAEFGEGGYWFADTEALTDRLRRLTGPGVNILVKGSRAMRMERVVGALLAGEPATEAR